MQIARWTVNDNLERENSAQGVSHRGLFHAGYSRVGNDYRVHVERLAILFQKIAKVIAPHFLLAFDQHCDVAGKLGVRLEIRFERAEMGKVLPLVIAGAAAIKELSLEAR